MFFKFKNLNYKQLSVISKSALTLAAVLYIGQQTFASEDDIDALLNQAQKNGDLRLNKANKEARIQFDAANATYSEYSKQIIDQSINNMSNTYGYSGLTDSNNSKRISTLKNLEFTQKMVDSTSCSGTYSQLAPVIKNYQDSGLQEMRNSVLNTDVADLIRQAKAQVGNKAKAIELSKMQATEHDNVAADAAQSSSETWGGPGEDLVAKLNGVRLPLNIQCNNSLPYMGICASVVNQWGSVASKFTAEILRKCW